MTESSAAQRPIEDFDQAVGGGGELVGRIPAIKRPSVVFFECLVEVSPPTGSLRTPPAGLLDLVVDLKELGEQKAELSRIPPHESKTGCFLSALVTAVRGEGNAGSVGHLLLRPAASTPEGQKSCTKRCSVVLEFHTANATALSSSSISPQLPASLRRIRHPAGGLLPHRAGPSRLLASSPPENRSARPGAFFSLDFETPERTGP
jgi:hypothetical protein